MSDSDAEAPAVWGRASTVLVVLSSILVLPASVLLADPSFGESGQAAATVGFVLAESLVLYAGYGALARVASPAVRERFEST